MHNIPGNISVLCAAALLAVSCLSSTRHEVGKDVIDFAPVLGTEVRSGDVSPFPEDMDFGVWAVTDDGDIYMDCSRVTYDGTGWYPELPVTWPDGTLRFIAVAPYRQDMVLENDLSLSLGEYDLSREDGGLYVADLTPGYGSSDKSVPLSFGRTVSMLDFRVANGLNTATSVRLEKIILKGVYVEGSFRSSSMPEWTVAGDKTDLTVYDSTVDGGNTDVARSPQAFGRTVSVIPQKSGPVVELVYSFQTADSQWLTGQSETTAELKAEWAPGRHYTYTLTLTENIVKHTSGISTAD